MNKFFALIAIFIFLFFFQTEALAQNTWNLERDSDNNLKFYFSPGGANPAMLLNTAGNFGLGIGTPASKLEVWGGSSPNALVTFGVSGGSGNDKIFRIISDTPNTETFTFIRNGFLGLGVSNPVQKLDAAGNIQANLYIDRDNAAYFLDPAGSSRINYIDADNLYSRGYLTAQYMLDANNNNYQVDPNGRTQLHDVYHDGILQANSDARLKKNVQQITDSLDKIGKLRGVSFDWRQDTDIKDLSTQRQIGMIAQEVESVIPELVNMSPLGYKGIDYSKLTSVLVEAIKEQQEQIKDQRDKTESLNKEVQELRLMVEQLKNSR